MPTAMPMTDYQRIRYALETVQHPIRLEILYLARSGHITAKAVSDATKIPLGTVAYHVRALDKMGYIRLVKTKRIRGAIQSYYATSARGHKIWNKLFPDDDA